jgi:uroporphyrin-III C-methyltransferase/precorrin-2 dehydrogenase/sirohydrochlorin ferrochelatase
MFFYLVKDGERRGSLLSRYRKKANVMKYFPVFLNFDGRRVVVVGGGEKAAQKLRLLAETRARVTIIAETISEEVRRGTRAQTIRVEQRAFEEDDVRGAALVIAADESPRRNAEISLAARVHGVPVNIVDDAQLSTAIVPAIVDRDPVVIAIGTEGASPIIARDLRARIEAWLPAGFGRLAARAAALRPRVRQAIADPGARRRFWENLLRGPFRNHVLAGDLSAAESEAERALRTSATDTNDTGSVVLIGCGPGDPDLLTLKALQRLQDADVLVYDRLVNPAILDYARRDAVRIDVGKSPAGETTAQSEINRILVREALKGRRVARLKGGDAMIFGRAAEEMGAVRAAGIEVEIVPGITAAHACAASIGLPLTLRSKVRQFSVVTGATEDGESNLDAESLTAPGHAAAIYMGVRNARQIQHKLLDSGAAADTPVVIVENGTRADERAVATTLADLVAAIEAEAIAGPAIIFLGLDWREAHLSRPDRVRVFHAASPSRAVAVPEMEKAA